MNKVLTLTGLPNKQKTCGTASTLNATSFISVIYFFYCSINHFRFSFCFPAASVKCRMAAVKRLPVLHHSADYFFSFGINEPVLVTLKIQYRLRSCVGGGGGDGAS